MTGPIVLPGAPQIPAVPPAARLATWREQVKDTATKWPGAVPTAWDALVYGTTTDNRLARMDDTTRALGTLSIASLGSLGIREPGGSLPLWLGAASWTGAMALTPRIINTAVYLKTGVNLNTKYMNSNGEIQPLFKDPGYTPLQVIPLEQRLRLAEGLGIDLDHPDRPTLLLDKVRQIAIQAHTWWMLMAGIATPVFASVICDRLENPAKDMVSNMRVWKAFHWDAAPALRHGNGPALTRAAEKVVSATVGGGTEVSLMSRLWKHLGSQMTDSLGIHAMPTHDLVKSSSAQLQDKLVSHLHDYLVQNPHSVQHRAKLADMLQHQQSVLGSVLAPVEKLLAQPGVDPLAAAKLKLQVQIERDSFEATLKHMRELLKMPLAEAGRDKAIAMMRDKMKLSTQAQVMDLLGKGSLSDALRMAAGEANFRKIVDNGMKKQYDIAFKQMGASPMEFMANAARSVGLRRQWIQRYPLLLGGFMLASTALYIGFFLGRDFKPAKPTERRA